MKVRVQYLAQLKQAAGRAAEDVELDGPCTVGELVARLAAEGGEALRLLLLDDRGKPRPALLLFVGDEQVPADNPAPLRDGDVVTLLAPMAGG